MKRFVLLSLFDIKPRKQGRLDHEHIARARGTVRLRTDDERDQLTPHVVLLAWDSTHYPWRFFAKRAFPRPLRPFPMRRFAIAAALIFLCIAAASSLFSVNTIRMHVEDQAAVGREAFERGGKYLLSGNTSDAERAFEEAAFSFSHARSSLDQAPFGAAAFLRAPLISSYANVARNIFSAGEEASWGAQKLSRTARLWGEVLPTKDPERFFAHERTNELRSLFEEAGNHFDRAKNHLSLVQAERIPKEYRNEFFALTQAIASFEGSVGSFGELSKALLSVLGFERPMLYLAVLQNSSEMRPAGGFAGNVVELSVEKGIIASMRVRDIYDIDGQITRHTVPPRPIQDISTAWSLHDANWFRDFPTSAKVMSEFYEDTEGKAVDGVIAINSPLFEKILVYTGAFNLPSGVEIKAGSAVDTLNRMGIGQKPGSTPQAQALGELLEMFKQRVSGLAGDQKQGMFSELFSAVSAHDLMVWFKEDNSQKLARWWDADGGLKPKERDFIAVVHANINGFKTDAVIQESQHLVTEVNAGGELLHTMTISRKHTAPGYSQDPLYARVNKDFVRLYVPKDSVLLSADGFAQDLYQPPLDYKNEGYRVHPEVEQQELSARGDQAGLEVSEEAGHTVFGGWSFTSPGETTKLRISWRVPGSVHSTEASGAHSWRMHVIKQPGWEPQFSATLEGEGRAHWQHPGNAEGRLLKDIFLGALFDL